MRSSVFAGVILVGSSPVGDWLLGALGISLPAFPIAGRLLLFAVAFEMVFGIPMRREGEAAEQAVEDARDVAAFPLAMPGLEASDYQCSARDNCSCR